MNNITPEQESEKILELTGGDLCSSLELLDKQVSTIHTRAQVLMSLCGVVITVTGFSGRIIAGTSLVSQISIIIGLAVVLISAIYLYAKVMRIRWFTTELETDSKKCLARIITRRNAKTKAYTIGGFILCCGFILYCVAVALMLLNPGH